MMTLYAILGVSEIASQAEVKTAYKKLALIYHPDKNPDNPAAEEFFKEINKAYQVLGNPYRRSTYDMQLRLGYTPTETVYEQPAYEQPPPFARRKRTVVDYKENWIATGYAFLFTFVVAVIVLILIGIKNYYDDMKMDQKLTQRREVFLEAKTLLNRGQVSASLDLINGLGGFYKPEAEIADFKIDLLNKINYDGYINYQRSNFHEALYYFEILQNQTDKSNMPIKEMMAIAYKKTNQPEKAIEILEGLLLSDYRFIFTYLELAEIYQDHLKNPVSALKYLELGNEKAKSYYETIYGKAYPLMISSSNLPEIHFTLYTRLAQGYLTNNDPDKALRAVRWNIQVWPDRSENYAIAARAHAMKNEMEIACFWLQKAKNINNTCCLEDFCL